MVFLAGVAFADEQVSTDKLDKPDSDVTVPATSSQYTSYFYLSSHLLHHTVKWPYICQYGVRFFFLIPLSHSVIDPIHSRAQNLVHVFAVSQYTILFWLPDILVFTAFFFLIYRHSMTNYLANIINSMAFA